MKVSCNIFLAVKGVTDNSEFYMTAWNKREINNLRVPSNFYNKRQTELEAPGIDPGTSRMLSERSTI